MDLPTREEISQGLHTVMVNLGTQSGKVIIKVARRVCVGGAQGKHSSYGKWFGPGDTRKEQAPLPVHEKQTITGAKLIAALRAIKDKCPGKPLLVVSDSELVCVGLQSKCAKWERHKWVGSRGLLAHKDLWTELWGQWQMLGSTVEILWVPSHVGVVGNEEADTRASKGARQALHNVLHSKQVTDILEELGLVEMLRHMGHRLQSVGGIVCHE